MKWPRSWGELALRVFCSGLLLTGYALLSTSTFALRMRNDIPADSLALVIALILAVIPLFAGSRYLSVFLVSSFVLSGVGGYWWTSIPWQRLVTNADFSAPRRPGFMDFALVASPIFLAAFYGALARVARVRADHKARGVEEDEARRAAGATFLAGSAALVASTALTAVLWVALANGWLLIRHPLVGVPAVIAAGALVAGAWVISTLRLGSDGRFKRGGRVRASPKRTLG